MSEKKTETVVTAQGEPFTQPMGLVERVQRTDTRLDFVPVLDIVVIAMLVSLLFTRFVILPGVRVDLPETQMRMQHTQQPVAVLTIGNNGMLFFDGDLYEAASIERGFIDYVDSSGRSDLVLLIKAESSLNLQAFLELCHFAKQAGFVQVQLAGQKEGQAGGVLSEGPLIKQTDRGIPVL